VTPFVHAEPELQAETTDPLISLRGVVSGTISRAFGERALEVASARGPLVRRSEHADFQCDVALALAKELGKKPREIATELEAALAKENVNGIIAGVSIAGPGFLNITLSAKWLDDAAARALESNRLGVPLAAVSGRVVIDYSAPNVAKEMHVGHLRSTIIGDSLARVLAFRGHDVIRQNHIGDWGTPFGMLLEHLSDVGETEASAPHATADLAAFYKAARARFDGDPAFADRARRRVVLLQSGDAETLERWKHFIAITTRYIQSLYDRLGVTLQPKDIAGESQYNDALPRITKELLDAGRARVDGGAVCLFPEGFKGKDDAPLPLIVQKSDGGFGYAATDLAAVRHRVDVLKATRVLYVVGAPQAQHLAMVFAAARELGWLPREIAAEHVAFGSVLGTDRKMFKSRAGETVRLSDLIDEAVQRASTVVEEKAPDLDAETRANVARMVGVGSVKYADLASDRVKDYVFDVERMVSFEGNTAGYLQYAHARICSIFRKAEPNEPIGPVRIGAPEERALVLSLLSFHSVLLSVEQHLEPHRIAGYLYDAALAFTAFYERCPVLKETGETRASRLALCRLTARSLACGLDLLGIEAPERM
jgi:arginyl-tRNA synthetase